MDTAHWPQEIVVKPIEDIVVVTNTCSSKPTSSSILDIKKPRPQKEEAVNCPRCHSINTKFCYYNNYSLTQPRYFCKTCRRYWTEGGSLRNIPVGGGSRKNKHRSSSSFSSAPSTTTTSSKKLLPDDDDGLVPPQNQNPKMLFHDGQDLNLGFPKFSELLIHQNNNNCSNTTTTSTTSHLSALGLFNGINGSSSSSSSRGLQYSFMPVPVSADDHDPNNTVYTTCGGFPLIQDFNKPPTLNFSLDGINGNAYASVQETSTGSVLFPFEDLKQVSSSTAATMDHQNHSNMNKEQHGDSAGFWNGMLGSGGSW